MGEEKRKEAKKKGWKKSRKKKKSQRKSMSLLPDLQRDGITALHGFSFTAASINI